MRNSEIRPRARDPELEKVDVEARACNIIIVSRTGERKHPMTVCSAPLPFPFLFLITAETKWTSTPPETLDLGTDFSSQESVSVFGIAKELPRRNSIRSGI